MTKFSINRRSLLYTVVSRHLCHSTAIKLCADRLHLSLAKVKLQLKYFSHAHMIVRDILFISFIQPVPLFIRYLV